MKEKKKKWKSEGKGKNQMNWIRKRNKRKRNERERENEKTNTAWIGAQAENAEDRSLTEDKPGWKEELQWNASAIDTRTR